MSAIDSALKSMAVNREKLGLASFNISNADTKDFVRREAIQESMVANGGVQGVKIVEIISKTNPLLEEALVNQISESTYAETKARYLELMNREFGSPGDHNSIDVYITEMFKQMNTLSSNLDTPSQKVIAVNAIVNVAEQISSLANTLQELRYAADTELANITIGLNSDLTNAYNYSQQARAMPSGTLEYTQVQQELQNSLRRLAEYFGTESFTNSNGELYVNTSTGISLVGPDHAYQAEYTPATAASNFTAGLPLNGFYITAMDSNGSNTPMNLTIVPPGVSGQTAYQPQSGIIGALLEMRDIEIPKALNQLDTLAQALKTQFNLVHNTGNGYPPATSLTATNLVSRNQTLGFSGSLRIAVVNESGLPYTNPAIPPLTLNLGALDTGSGAGKPNLEGIINEINYHFNQRYATENSITMGNLSNIRLAAVSNAMNPSSSFTMDLELSNYSGTSSQFNITSVTATDSLNNNILGSFNASTFTVPTGTTERTGTSGPSIVLNNTSSPLNFPYTVTVNCDVFNSSTGTTSTATITFLMNNPTPDPLNGIINDRFAPTSATGQATIVQPTLATGILTATLLDDQGNVIPDNSTQAGRLNLSTSQSGYLIAIDQMDSKYLGNPAANVLPTYEGFSNFFGINDLFIRTDAPENSNTLQNTAVYLGVRQDIQSNPNLLSTGVLKQTHSNFANEPIYTYNVTAGDNQVLVNLVELGNQQFFFPTASGLPSATVTFSSYATEILSFNSVTTSLAVRSAESAQLFREALEDKIFSVSGVDMNNELTAIILYQQIFAASSKVVETSRNLWDSLISIIGR